jgi:hypothetical protein
MAFSAAETAPDYTTAASPYPGAANAWVRGLYGLAPDETFVGWDTPDGFRPESATDYTDNDHSVDHPGNTFGNGLVRTWEIMGDTSSNDVGACSSDDTYVKVTTNAFSFRVRKPVAP